jgi:hypothetical protein
MKDSALVLSAIIVIVALGWVLGWTTSKAVPPTYWYFIEGKVYEKMGDYYATVVPARTCISVDKD